MPFMHKLSRRLALLKDIVWVIPVVAGACQFPEPRTGPSEPRISRLILSPPSALLRINQNTDLAVVGFTESGDTAPIAVSFRVSGTAGGRISSVSEAGGKEIAHYSAAATAGQDSVIGSDTSGLADTSVVFVTLMPVVSVTVTPASATLLPGQTTSFTATARDSTGTILTRLITWSSTNPAVATVSAAGLATGVTLGSAAIIATSEGKSDTAIVTVINVPVASVTVAPASATIAVGATTQLSATPRDSTGAVLTGRVVTWTSTKTTVATVSATGVARGVAVGSASIIATCEGKADTSAVTVILVPVSSVTVTPSSATIAVGATTTFTATTRDSAGAILTGRVITWASTNALVATVSAAGVATGVTAGTASVIATSEGKADTAVVTVIVVPVASVTVTPVTATVQVGLTTAFTATPRDSAGGLLTGRVVTWTSTNLAVATVNATGVATGVAVGATSIIAASEGKADTAALTVVAASVGGLADPTLLPLANHQAPNYTAYAALNVPNQPAGFAYNDPVTGVRIWKATSSTVPVSNGVGIGHDYSDGTNEVSLGWGPNNNTHTILLLLNGQAGNYYLVDFTRGVGFSNYRRIPDAAQPRLDLCFSFSNLPSQPRIAYILTATQLIRFNTATMQIENTGNFPLNRSLSMWLQQDRNDVWFAGLVSGSTVFAWNSQTNQYLTHSETWLDEGRLERDGRYMLLENGGSTFRYWDVSTNSLGPVQNDALAWAAHLGDMRGMWVTSNANVATPLQEDRYTVSGGQVVRTKILANSFGNEIHHSGNWVQTDAELGGNLNRQWYYATGFAQDDPLFLWRQSVGLARADGSDQRLLLHHYSSLSPTYYAIPWGKPSPDGKVVIFNSNMDGSGRYDLFVAEVPLKGP